MTPAWLFPFDVPVVIGRDEAQRRAVAELAKAKYGGTPEWMRDAAERVARLLERLADTVQRVLTLGQGGGGGISWGFVLAVVLLLAAIGLVVWRVGLPRWRRRYGGATVDLEAEKPAADYRSTAAAAAEVGDWTNAVRDRFRAVVRELEIRTILDVRPARTAWEAAFSAAKELPDCRDQLRTGAESFNAVVYGDRPADQQTYAAMVALDEQVTAAADRAPVPA
jgi:hypothetical protein